MPALGWIKGFAQSFFFIYIYLIFLPKTDPSLPVWGISTLPEITNLLCRSLHFLFLILPNALHYPIVLLNLTILDIFLLNNAARGSARAI